MSSIHNYIFVIHCYICYICYISSTKGIDNLKIFASFQAYNMGHSPELGYICLHLLPNNLSPTYEIETFNKLVFKYWYLRFLLLVSVNSDNEIFPFFWNQDFWNITQMINNLLNFDSNLNLAFYLKNDEERSDFSVVVNLNLIVYIMTLKHLLKSM